MAELEGLLATVSALREVAARLPSGAPGRNEVAELVERMAAELDRHAEAFPSRASAVVRLGQAAAGMANDFNNVLMTILGNAEVALADLPHGSRSRDHLEEIARAAQKGAHLTRQMLDALRSGAPAVGSTDLEELARALVAAVRSALPATAAVELALGRETPRVGLDAGSVAAGFQRLVNALAALDLDACRVSLATGVTACEREDFERSWGQADLPEGRYAFLEMTITAPGRVISPVELLASHRDDAAPWQGDDTLAPLLDVARSHRGAVVVQPRADGALAVRLLVPAMAGNGLTRRGEGRGGAGALVLLVDDDPQVRAVASKMLEMQGVKVLTAADGAAGVEMFRRHASDIALVVLDLAMPVMDGEQAFRHMVRLRPDVRVVISTGYDEARASERLAGANLAGFIQKPYRLASLRDVVRGVLDGS